MNIIYFIKGKKIKTRGLNLYEKKMLVLDIVIEYLKECKAIDDRPNEAGLCIILSNAIQFLIPSAPYPSIEIFKKFSRKFAIKYANAGESSIIWWDMDPFDYDNRILFLEYVKKAEPALVEDKRFKKLPQILKKIFLKSYYRQGFVYVETQCNEIKLANNSDTAKWLNELEVKTISNKKADQIAFKYFNEKFPEYNGYINLY